MPSIWELHRRILFIVFLLAAIVFVLLVLGAQGRGLDGLACALGAIALVSGTLQYAAVSTLLVGTVKRRRNVWLAHAATPPLGIGFWYVLTLL